MMSATKRGVLVICAMALLVASSFITPAGAQADINGDGFTFRMNHLDDGIVVSGCDGTCPTSLSIPATLGGYPVTEVGSLAFHSSNLTSVTIPNSVTSIGTRAFWNNALTSIDLGSGVTGFGAYAFASNKLAAVAIPISVTQINEYAFSDNNLESLNLPDSVTEIGTNAFASNRLTSLTISKSVTRISSGAFRNNKLTSITIPASVGQIDDYAFFDNRLISLTIPGTVVGIGRYAFAFNELTDANFLGNAPSFGEAVFEENRGLRGITRAPSATGWRSTWSGVSVGVPKRAAATVRPRITGTAKVSKTLTAAKGTWAGFPAPIFTYQWYACTRAVTAVRTTVPSTCKKIAGATRSTFKLTRTQRGKHITVLVSGKSARTPATSWLAKSTTKVK